jgi:glycosyltransferase involved in cell wall biosynthesis
MGETRSIAIISPHAWPPHDDVTWRIAHEADALARRGHGVSILTPVRGPDLLAESRRRLQAVRAGDASAAVAEPGAVLVVPLGRSLPAGPRRHIGGPLDLAAALEDVLSRVRYDVVHIHEPLAPSPALAALRHVQGVTAATFYRPEQLAGVAFVQPLLERAIARVDVWAATSDAARRAVTELLARDCHVLPGGVDPERFHPPTGEAQEAPGLVVIARSPDRAGLRFAFRVLRGLAPDTLGAVTVLGPGTAPWRTRAAIPKAFRDVATVIPDTGPGARQAAFRAGRVALVPTPDDLQGSAALEAMACGMAVLVPRCGEADALLVHGREGLALPAFSREVWIATIAELTREGDRRAELGRNAVARATTRTWDDVAAELDDLYASVNRREDVVDRSRGRVVADLRVAPGPGLTPREIVDACLARGVDVVAVVAEGTIEPGREAARVARDRLTVIPGQRIHTGEGVLVGLFLTDAVADGAGIEATAETIHGQGGVVVAPPPVWGDSPSEDLLRRNRSAIDCVEAVAGPAPPTRPGVGADAARLVQRFGLLITAGSGATVAEEIGSAHLRMRPFKSPREFLDALVDAEPAQRRRGLRVRGTRERRRSDRYAT